MHPFAHCHTAEGEDLHFEGASASGVVNGSLLEMALEQRFRNPQDGVVDASGRSHEVENLWIVDNSTFPSALAANPALTQVALALRSSQHLLAGH